MKIRKRQMMAAVLAAVVTAGNAPLSYGAPAAVETDETMYVNLDVYGKAQKVNVVKSCSLNGVTDFTDYGNYLAVENMSTQDEPQLGEGEVVWKLPPDRRERFYYKCTLDQEQTALPWNFDVSYKLNGVPTDGEKLAGASGLVEIHIKAEPNEQADLYYRNNMLLLVAVPVDMSKCFSVEAEGSQTQNMGELTAVVFTALPGEEGDYTVRIGSDSFETTGVIMAMTPGTVEDLEHIKDLKEAKDTWQDAGDELYDSLEQMAQSIDDMSALTERTTEALNSTTDTLTLVQNTLKASSDEMDVAAKDSLMASMELLNKSLNVLDSTAGIRRAGRTMKDVIDSQLDKFDTENRFLFMDPDAEKVSFTSSKNPEPRTLQVVLRTDEISLENEEHKTLDAETEEPEVSPLKRMWNVLVKMWRSLVDIFKNR